MKYLHDLFALPENGEFSLGLINFFTLFVEYLFFMFENNKFIEFLGFC